MQWQSPRQKRTKGRESTITFYTNTNTYRVRQSFDKASTAYGMEISAEKTELMTNNTCDINTEIKVNGQKLETVTSFKYLDLVIT